MAAEFHIWETVKAYLKSEDVERFEPFKERREGSSEYVIRLDTMPDYHEDSRMIEWKLRPNDRAEWWTDNPNPWASIMIHEDDHETHHRLFPYLSDGDGEHQG